MTNPATNNLTGEAIRIRLAESDDRDAIRALFNQSLIEGQTDNGDTGEDIENLQDWYFADDGASGFWVAEYENQIVGMIGVRCMHDDVAEMRRLRVAPAYRRQGVGSRLMEQAVRFCKDQGYLKVRLDVRSERTPAIALFEKLGFVHSRTREMEGRKRLDFYLDLYSDPDSNNHT